MKLSDLASSVSNKNFDLDHFVQLAIEDENAREEMIRLLTHDPNIMVYYHCYYVIDAASRQQPELFYSHWDDFAALLNHPNSYHRDFGITLSANLTRVDHCDRFSILFEEYFAHLHDPKFMTACCCISNSLKIIRNKPGLKDMIIARLLDIERQCDYPSKQKALIKCAVLEIFEQVYEEMDNKSQINAFILGELKSLSPKTRKKAKELAQKYRLV
jgi:hypothetical protein